MDIKEIRKKLGLTQVEFAAKVGASPSTIAKWEQGGEVSKMARQLIKAKIKGVA